jgi:hypothetical protein
MTYPKPYQTLRVNGRTAAFKEFANGPGFGYTVSATMWQVFKEFLLFLRQEKKWWLIPLVVVLLLLGALILFTGTSVLGPLMYPFL